MSYPIRQLSSLNILEEFKSSEITKDQKRLPFHEEFHCTHRIGMVDEIADL